MQKENTTTTHKPVIANVTTNFVTKAGTVSKELQAQKWRLNLQGLGNVVRLFLSG